MNSNQNALFRKTKEQSLLQKFFINKLAFNIQTRIKKQNLTQLSPGTKIINDPSMTTKNYSTKTAYE
jgi:hypothetical protein